MPISEAQVVSKQHAVPQNIMDVEFKLIGDLTMRQFMYLCVFGGLAWVSFSIVSGIFKWPFVIVFSLLGLGLAFFTISDRGLDQWIVSFFKSMYAPTQKTWRKDPTVPSIFMYQNIAVVRHELVALAPTSSRRKLEEYLDYQSKTQKEDRLDIPEAEYVAKIRAAFESEMQVYSQGAAPTTTVVTEPELVEPLVPIGGEPPYEAPQPEPTPQQPSGGQPSAPQEIKPERPLPTPSAPKEVRQAELRTSAPQKQKPPKLSQPIVTKPHQYVPSTPITPDRRTGRVFTSLLPQQGEFVLPIRGEKVLSTSDQLDLEEDVETKAEQLKKLIAQIKTDETYKQVLKTATPQLPQAEISGEPRAGGSPTIEKPQQILDAVKEENNRLTSEIEKLKLEIAKSQQEGQEKFKKQQELQKLQETKAHVNEDVKTLQSSVNILQERAFQAESKPMPPTFAKIQPLSSKANTISGVVKTDMGQVLDGIVIVIKDSRGEPKRALKTNSLGQFSISTSLENGKYVVEVDASNKSGLIFDIISVDANGAIIPPIEFIGRKS